jgi:hypothetical protein
MPLLGTALRQGRRRGGIQDLPFYQREDDMKASDSEVIAKRAYEKFVRRGGEHGHHERDWLEAEHEFKEGKTIVDSQYRDNNRMFQGHGERGHRHGGGA